MHYQNFRNMAHLSPLAITEVTNTIVAYALASIYQYAKDLVLELGFSVL
jgi:hypothetical protein